jgi:hypothetical protein
VATQKPDLFSPLDPAQPEPVSRIGGKSESPERIAASFLEAADVLAAAWRAERAKDYELFIALPIIHTYRHAIELTLKYQCFEIRRLVQTGLVMGYGTDTVPANLEEKLAKAHSIAQLINILHGLMSGLDTDKASSQLRQNIRDTLDYLHAAYAAGTAFRYATEKVPGSNPAVYVPVRPNDTLIYLDSTITRLHDAAVMLTDGLGGYLWAYDGLLSDLLSEHQSNLYYDQHPCG